MNIYFLGTGSECNYQFPRRKNTSLLLEMGEENAIIDIGDSFPDNWNLLKRKFPYLKFPSVLMFSHPHIDHICSFAAFRHYAEKENVTFRTYATKDTMEEILKVFHWLTAHDFGEVTYLNYGEKIEISNEDFIPFKLLHGKFDTTGFRFGENAFFSDFGGSISQESLKSVKGARNVIMECNDLGEKKLFHNNLANAIELSRNIYNNSKIDALLLTHLSDDFPVEKTECQEIIASRYPDEKFKILIPSDLDKFSL
jgi:phosphoribosyl 1,2-cyclic phosphodiesterase